MLMEAPHPQPAVPDSFESEEDALRWIFENVKEQCSNEDWQRFAHDVPVEVENDVGRKVMFKLIAEGTKERGTLGLFVRWRGTLAKSNVLILPASNRDELIRMLKEGMKTLKQEKEHSPEDSVGGLSMKWRLLLFALLLTAVGGMTAYIARDMEKQRERQEQREKRKEQEQHRDRSPQNF